MYHHVPEIFKNKIVLMAFADDLNIYFSLSDTDLGKILDSINSFSKVSNYKINPIKSLIFLINPIIHTDSYFPDSGIKLKYTPKYLGITLEYSLKLFMHNNLLKVWSNIDQDIQRWGKMKPLFLSNAAIIKINILPRLLFQLNATNLII